MKPQLLFLSFFTLIFFTGCKFEYTPVGVYTGQYTAYGFPTTSGTGTLTIESNGGDRYNFLLVSSGNSDIYISNIQLARTSGVYGTNYDGDYGVNQNDTTVYIETYEHDPHFGHEDNSVEFRFEADVPTLRSITFNGVR